MSDVAENLGIIQKAVATAARVGAKMDFWSALADDDLLRHVVKVALDAAALKELRIDLARPVSTDISKLEGILARQGARIPEEVDDPFREKCSKVMQGQPAARFILPPWLGGECLRPDMPEFEEIASELKSLGLELREVSCIRLYFSDGQVPERINLDRLAKDGFVIDQFLTDVKLAIARRNRVAALFAE